MWFSPQDFFFEDLPPHIKSIRKVSFGDLLPGNLKSLDMQRFVVSQRNNGVQLIGKETSRNR